MRGLLIVLVFSVGLLYTLRTPFTGVFLFYWISIMNPHRYAWGFVRDAPLAQIAALATLVGVFLHWKEVVVPRSRELYLFLALWGFVSLTTLFAFYPGPARGTWSLVSKIFFMVLVPMTILTTRRRLTLFVLGLTAFVGFVGVKGAIFGIRTGGEYRIWGPPKSFLADNNSMALAMVMLIPACFLLKDIFVKRWQRWTMLFVGWAMAMSVVLTYSRGGFLGLVAVGVLVLLNARRRFPILIAVVVAAVLLVQVGPDKWKDRMSTLEEYDEDSSASMRINSWTAAYRIALDNPLGGGFECFTMDQYYRYAPDPELGRTKGGGASVAHSIYFEVLASHGFGGLFLYLLTVVSTLVSVYKVDRIAGRDPEDPWLRAIARSLAAGMIGFLVSGAFLSRAFFDLFWAMFGAAVCLKFHVVHGDWLRDRDAGIPGWIRGAPGAPDDGGSDRRRRRRVRLGPMPARTAAGGD